MKNKILTLTALSMVLAALFIGPKAKAEEVELGWMNIEPCMTDFQFSDQRLVLYFHYNSNAGRDIAYEVQSCAIQGAVAAGIGAMISDGAAAAPAFWASLADCLGESVYSQIDDLNFYAQAQCD